MKRFTLFITLFATIILVGCSTSSSKNHYGVYSNSDDFLADPETGCLVDKYYLKSDDPSLFRWQGECIDGFAIGKGRLIWFNKDGKQSFHDTCLRPEHRQANCHTSSSMP